MEVVDDEYVPEEATAGPSAPDIHGAEQQQEFDWWNEPQNEIPLSVWNNMTQSAPAGSLPILVNEWNRIRSFINQTYVRVHQFNYRLLGSHQRSAAEYFEWMFQQHLGPSGHSFRIKASLHLLLRHKTKNTFKFFYASSNNYNIPVGGQMNGNTYFLIHDEASRDTFKDALSPLNLAEHAHTAMDNTEWVLSRVLGIHFWILEESDMPIGAPFSFPHYLRHNKFIRTYQYDNTRNCYNDNLCAFRLVQDCLGHTLDQKNVVENFKKFCRQQGWNTDPKTFPGIQLHDLDKLEDFFNLRLHVYHMQEDLRVRLIRRSVEKEDVPLFHAHLLKTQTGTYHFSRILNLNRFAKAYYCDFCDKGFKRAYHLDRHIQQKQCSRGITSLSFPGGTFKSSPSVFRRLEEVGVLVEAECQVYPWRATFDWEALLKPIQISVQRPDVTGENEQRVRDTLTNLEIDIETTEEELRKQQFMSEHQPLTFSIASLVPDFDKHPKILTNVDPDLLVGEFIDYLEIMSESAQELLRVKYDEQIKALDALIQTAQKEHETKERAWNEKHTKRRRGTPTKAWLNKVLSVKSQFNSWMNQLVIIGFNSGRNDLTLIRKYLYPRLVDRALENMKEQPITGYDARMVKLLKLNLKKAAVEDSVSLESDSEEEEDLELEDEEQTIDQAELPENDPFRLNNLPFIIKQASGVLCLTTKSLKFLDMSRYLSAGTSLDQFLKAWEKNDKLLVEKGQVVQHGVINGTKIPFPYSFLDDVTKLNFVGVPAKSDFKNHLRKTQITDAEYQIVVDLYSKHGFRTFKEYLEYYIMLDTVPFLQAVNKTFDLFHKITGIDMFKECLSLPGITLKFLERNTPHFDFSLFGKSDADLYQSLRQSICGGLAVVNNRHAKVGETQIRGNPDNVVKNIFGLDFNSLYLAALAQDMPSGWFDHWKLQYGRFGPYLRKERTNQPIAAEWLDYVAKSRCIQIEHAERNGFEKSVGPRMLPVDGLDMENKRVFEFLGCYWHTHAPSECSCNQQTKNKTTGKTYVDCHTELMGRKEYMESQGYSFEYIWECQWRKKREEPNVKSVVQNSTSKYFKEKKNVPHKKMLEAIRDDQVFGFVKVDIHTPQHLKGFFSDFPPIVKHAKISINDIGPHMKEWCTKMGELNKSRQSLIGSYFEEEVWLLTPVISYLMQKGLVITKIHEVLQYERKACFEWFRDTVAEKRAEADKIPEMALIADTFKLLGNTGYGKTLTCLEKHFTVALVHSDQLRAFISDPFLHHIEPMVKETFEVTMRPRKKKMDLPIQIGLAVYQYAKLYMLKFAYEVLGECADPSKYDWMESDTDSIYLMSACDTFDELILPEKKQLYDQIKHKYMVINVKTQKREPGLLKLEFDGGQEMVCLCAKTYALKGKDETKLSSKGLMKRTNEFDIEEFKKVLITKEAGCGINVGFIQKQNVIQTYVQERAGLSYLYVKRKVLEDGVSTVPLEI